VNRLSAREFFSALDGQEYDTYRQLQEAVRRQFNEHLADFPPQYSYLQLIEWGERQRWIRPADGARFRIQVDQGQPSAT
jgi:hypothetical protein